MACAAGVCASPCAEERRPRLRHRQVEHLADVLCRRAGSPAPTAWKRLALAVLARTVGDAGHHRQVGVDHAGAVAGGAGALGVGAEQGRLHAVGLGERLADRLEQPGVRRRVAAPRAADRGLVDRHHARPRRATEPWISELLPEPATPVTTTSTPSGMSTSTFCRLWVSAPRDLQHARSACAPTSFSEARSSEVAAGEGAAGRAARRRCPRRRPRRRRCRRPGRGRRRGRRSRSSPACARRRARCCPCPRSRSSRSFIRWMSCGCSPIVGSSKT